MKRSAGPFRADGETSGYSNSGTIQTGENEFVTLSAESVPTEIRRTGIPESLRATDKDLEILLHLIAELNSRLSPVLAPAKDKPAMGADSPGDTSAMNETLIKHLGMIQYGQEMVQELIERLDF